EVKKADRIILLEGQVRRPGIYQLLPGEGVGELVRVYGDGTLVSAKTDTVVLTHKASAEKPASESIVFDLSGASLPALVDGDTVRVVSREEYLPVVYVEGAVLSEQAVTAAAGQGQGAGVQASGTQAQGAQEAVKEPYSILRVPYRKGQLLSQVVKPLLEKLSPRADLSQAYIARGTSRIAVNLEKLMHFYTAADDVVLQADDHIVIPYGLNYAYVKGEVQKAALVEVSSDSRLSEVLKGLTTGLSSLRDVRVTALDGSVRSYDLFKAERFGDPSQNPLLRPGDVVEVSKATRIVSIEGEVRRPGRYQLLAGEGVKELVSYYGDGALESGRTDLVVLTRKATSQKPESESVVFDLGGKGLPELMDGDRVRIPSREEYLPIVYIEGAVAGDQLAITSKDQTVTSTSYAVIRAPFRKGMSVSSLLRPMKEKILSSANLANAFIIRKGSPNQTSVDLERLLYANDLHYDFELQPEDRLVIPFGSMYVFVTGEVTKSTWVGITGLTRLRDVVYPLVTRYSSIRNVVVKQLMEMKKPMIYSRPTDMETYRKIHSFALVTK
ncbi:MAG: SLBB domain-containing protein, partial [Nitrospirota bacterium]